jgi:hypothetical protein
VILNLLQDTGRFIARAADIGPLAGHCSPQLDDPGSVEHNRIDLDLDRIVGLPFAARDCDSL